VLCVVRSLRRAYHLSRGVLPTVVRRCVCSRNLVEEEALAHWTGGLLRQKKFHCNMTFRGTANGCRRLYQIFTDTNAKLLVFVAVSITVPDIYQKAIRALDMLHWNFLKIIYINKYYMLTVRLHCRYFRRCCLLCVCVFLWMTGF
jgi:hypothetical protein